MYVGQGFAYLSHHFKGVRVSLFTSQSRRLHENKGVLRDPQLFSYVSSLNQLGIEPSFCVNHAVDGDTPVHLASQHPCLFEKLRNRP